MCWIPSHISIPGNEKVDKAAKLALSLDMKILYTDFRPSIYNDLKTKWQFLWDLQQKKTSCIK